MLCLLSQSALVTLLEGVGRGIAVNVMGRGIAVNVMGRGIAVPAVCERKLAGPQYLRA
jgi:hypothetical protein